jgi:proteasome accessory factor B
MSKTPQSLHSRPPLERMLRIHEIIRTGSYPNATRLASELEVSSKSIHRDIEFMRDRLGLPIEYDERRWGYYYTGEVSSFPSLQISEGELFSLVVAEKALQQFRGTPFEKPLSSALHKISQSLPDTISLQLSDWDQSIAFRSHAVPVQNLDIFDTLARATSGRKQIEIVYRKPGRAEAETRVVDPCQLVNIDGEWYLFAFDHLRKDIRTFVPSRIQKARQTGKTFERPRKFSLENRLRGSFGVHSGQGEYNVVIRFSPAVADFIREKQWHESQRLREMKDGRVELSMNLTSLVEVERWILSWGGHAVVMAPKELAGNVRAAAERILKSMPEP